MSIELNLDSEPTPEANFDLPEYFDLEVTPKLSSLCQELALANREGDDQDIKRLAADFRSVTEELTKNPESDEESKNRTRIGVQVLTAFIYREAGNEEEYIAELKDALTVADGYAQEKESYLDVVYWIEDLLYPPDAETS